MKQKIAGFLVLCALFVGAANAQERRVTGKVTSTIDGSPIPGVTIAATGTTIGTQTDVNGYYSLEIPVSTASLTFSFIGYQRKVVNLGEVDVINVELDDDSQALSEVVVTALGVERTRNSIGYSIQSLRGEELTQIRQADLNTALAGKIAGVQVQSGSGASFSNSTIRIRGINTLTGADPIYVVDGMVTSPEAVNMDDVADLSVLKGPAATALYGQRGSEGAVIIKTKSGTVTDGVGIEVNQATTFENVYLLPKYQNEYGGGYTQDWSTFTYNPATDPEYLAPLDGVNYYNYGADESWGPLMDGTLHAPWYAWDPTHPGFGQIIPFSPQPNNVRDFYNTGVSANSNIAFSKAGDGYSTRVSYTNVSRTGVIPNSKQSRNWLSTNSSINPTDRLTISANVNFQHEVLDNVPNEGYGSQTSGSFNQWFARNLEMDQLRHYQRPDGSFRSWNIVSPRNDSPAYWDNPYTEVYENTAYGINQRLYGNVTANYKFTNALSASVIARGNFLNNESTSRVASGTISQDEFYQYLNSQRELNYVGTVGYKDAFGDFTLDASAFAEYRRNRRRYTEGRTAGGLAVPDLYTLDASVDRPTVTSRFFDQQVNSIYGYAAVGYKEFAFLEGNLRNDWSSTLPPSNNSFLYGGLSGSFVFSRFITPNDVFSFGKVRASFARVGTDTNPYEIMQTYNVGNPYGANPILTVPNTIPNINLRPTLSTSYEVGTELRFFRDRLAFDFNYYTRSARDQIINLPISGTTGYDQALINAGQIDNSGFEFSLGGSPVINDNFKWYINANLGVNRNRVVDIYEGTNNLQVNLDGASSSFGFVGSPLITLNAFRGESYGQLVGMGIVKDANGNRLVDDNGFYLTEDNMDLGSIIPDFTGGLTSTFSYKDFRAGFSLDFQKGGKYMSITSMFGNYSGILAQTAGLNENGIPRRNPIAEGGGTLLPGVKQDGTPNDIFVDTQELYEERLFSVWENWVYDRSFVKLRELSLGYDIPVSVYARTPFKAIVFSLIATNPWLIYAKNRDVDPSILENSWFEGGQLPNTRSFGFNVRLSL